MDTLIIERSAGVLTVTLNRPERRNAAPISMWRELTEVFTEARRRPDDRVVVVTGAGGAFCAGADLADPEMNDLHQVSYMRVVGDAGAGSPSPPATFHRQGRRRRRRRRLQPCLRVRSGRREQRGALLRDLLRRGLSLDFGGSWLLPRRVGLHKAKELAFFGDILSASEAADFGLVNRVVPREELDGFVAEWACRLAAGPPLALSATKAMLDGSFSMGMAEALEREGVTQIMNLTSEDAREAISAFLEKRDATFKGR